MKISEYHLGFIGFGHMAQVICLAIERAKLIPRSQIGFIRQDPQKMRQNEREFGITAARLETLVEQSDLLLLCVRPHQAASILEKLRDLPPSKMVVSVLAGVPLSFYQKYLNTPLLRVMPNIASAVGQGMSLFTYGPDVSIELKSLTHLLFSCMGEVIEIPESQMDIGCGIAGSGPGFVFALIEAAARLGEKQGIAYPKALKMAAQTFAGAAQLILKGHPPETLLQQIATPNGVTEAGLKKMRSLHLGEQFQSVIEAAAERSRDLLK